MCVLEPAAAESDGALPDGAESEPPRLPDPAPGGAPRPLHAHARPLLQEETSPRGQLRPQQVRAGHCTQGDSTMTG